MPALFIYLIKVNVALLIFCAGYYAVLRHLTFYNLNRIYLVTAIIFSTLYPRINLSDYINRHDGIAKPIKVVMVNWQEPVKTVVKTFAGHDQWFWLQTVFWIGVCVFAIRLSIQLISLYRLHKLSEPVQLHQYMIRVIKGNINPFSFWRNIYINPDNHPPHELNAILAHEQIHVSEWHTLDILLGEVSAIFYWFNPGIWLMKRAIRENIEFITDQKILQKGADSKAYQYSLLNVNFGAQSNPIVNHFNISTIKKRIMMMNAKRSSNVNITRYLFLIPAVMVLLLVFSVSKAELNKAVKSSKHMLVDIKKVITKINFISGTTTPANRKQTEILTTAASFFHITEDTIPKGKMNGVTLTYSTDTSAVVKHFQSKNIYYYATSTTDTNKKAVITLKGIAGEGKPEIYINGVKTDVGLENISPNNIRSVDVIKDKTGSSNGSIYITTGDGYMVKNLTGKKMTDTAYKAYTLSLSSAPRMTVNGSAVSINTSTRPVKVRLNGSMIDPKDQTITKTIVNGDTLYTTNIKVVKGTGRVLMRDSDYKGNLAIITHDNAERVVTGYSTNSRVMPAHIINLRTASAVNFADKLVIIDGKEATEKQLKKISVDKIDSVSNLDAEAATKQYGDKGKKGAVIVTTKK